MDNIRTENRKARKDYKCDYCGSNIFKGETYENQTNSFDGTIYDWKSCKHCEDIVSKMWKDWGDSYGDGLGDQSFREYISENNIKFTPR